METILRSMTSVVSTLFRKVFKYKTQEVYGRATGKYRDKLFNIPDQYKRDLYKRICS